MDHETIERNNLIERYLLGRLAPEEAARFEEHFLDCAQCLDQLEISQRLCQGLKDVSSQEQARRTWATLLAGLLVRRRALLSVALAALILLPWALLAPRLWRLSSEWNRVAAELEQALSPQAGALTYALSPERSAAGVEPSTRVTLRSTPEWVTFALQLPPSESRGQFQVRLRKSQGELVWESGPLDGDASSPVTLSLHSTWLEEAIYSVELDILTPGGGSQPLARFGFRVRFEENRKKI